MNKVLVSLAVFGLGVPAASAQMPGITSSNSSTCTIVTLKNGQSPPMATPMGALPTAGGSGKAEMVGQIPSSSTRSDGSKVVVDASGKCTIYQREPR